MSNIHRSTTTPERFYHIKEQFTDKKGKTYKAGTVFMRQEQKDDPWYVSVARCSINDNFCKRTGRTVARRRYFQTIDGYSRETSLPTISAPSYEEAVRIYKSI